jgi:hypothetical protein
MECGIIFWGDSVESKRIFQQQKKNNQNYDRIYTRISCRTLFQKLEILTDLPIHTFLDEVPLIKSGDLHV